MKLMTYTEACEWCKERDYAPKEMDEDSVEYFIDVYGMPMNKRIDGTLYSFYGKIYALTYVGDEATYGYLIERRTKDRKRTKYEYHRI